MIYVQSANSARQVDSQLAAVGEGPSPERLRLAQRPAKGAGLLAVTAVAVSPEADHDFDEPGPVDPAPPRGAFGPVVVGASATRTDGTEPGGTPVRTRSTEHGGPCRAEAHVLGMGVH
jgi:hypothetical protein